MSQGQLQKQIGLGKITPLQYGNNMENIKRIYK